jgi:hypothetical protein
MQRLVVPTGNTDEIVMSCLEGGRFADTAVSVDRPINQYRGARCKIQLELPLDAWMLAFDWVTVETIPPTNGDTRALIRAVTRTVEHRLQQPQIYRMIPDDDATNVDHMETPILICPFWGHEVAMTNEMRESCFMGFGSFV